MLKQHLVLGPAGRLCPGGCPGHRRRLQILAFESDGLGADDSLRLADILQREIDLGRTERFARIYASKQEATPNEPCDLCEGTGTRKRAPEGGAGDPKNGGSRCNGCDGTGFRRPFDCDCPFNVENVVRFLAFLRGCGGFMIC
jgi:hypothetical protein